MRKLTVLIVVLLLALSVIGVAYAQSRPFDQAWIAWLTGAEEVPPVATDAIGVTLLWTNRDRSHLDFAIFVRDLEDAFMAHIHCAPPGMNGPIGVTFFMHDPVTADNVLSFGRITAPDPGNACGWTSLADVFAAIRDGNAYVNVHTVQFGPGEIRGQIEPLHFD